MFVFFKHYVYTSIQQPALLNYPDESRGFFGLLQTTSKKGESNEF